MGEGNPKDWPRDRACCTIVVFPGESIQGAIDALPPQGGCVCLKIGVHAIDQSLVIAKSNVILHGEAPGVRVVMTKPQFGMLAIIDTVGGTTVENVEVTHITFDYSVYFDPPDGPTIIAIADARRIRVIHCELLYTNAHEKMLIHGVGINKAADVAISDCLFDRMEAGVYVHDYGSDLVVADNVFRGQLQQGPDGTTITYNWMAVLLGQQADGVVRDNLIEDFQRGVWAFGNHAVVRDNRIRLFAMPPAPDNPPNGQTAIAVSTRLPSLVEGNDIELNSLTDCGIAVGGDCRVLGNVVRSRYEKPDLDGPIGINVRHERSIIADNHLLGSQVGIRAEQTTGTQISDNVIDGDGAAPVGIRLDGCHDCLVSDNELRNLMLPFMLTDGVQNRLTGNAASATRIGAWFSREYGLEVTDGSFDDAAFLGVACVDLGGTAHFSHLRTRRCGAMAPSVAFGLVLVNDSKAVLEATIANCDVLDTGVAADGSVTPGVAWGVATLFTSHLEISGNRVIHPLATPLPASAEHRALKLIGMPAERIAGRPPRERASGAAIINGNVFQGPSRDRLVDVRRLALTDNFDLRFEKLTFAVNRCDHFGRRGPQNVTADLYGSRMIVTSNQVKTPDKGHSFGFGNRPKVTATSNQTTGDYVGVASTVPAPLLNFNVI